MPSQKVTCPTCGAQLQCVEEIQLKDGKKRVNIRCAHCNQLLYGEEQKPGE